MSPRAEGSDQFQLRAISPSTTNRRNATARPASTKSSRRTARRVSRSTRRIAFTAKRAISRTLRRTSTGWFRKAPAGRIIRTCERWSFEREERPAAPNAETSSRTRNGHLGESIEHRPRNQCIERIPDEHVRPRIAALCRAAESGVPHRQRRDRRRSSETREPDPFLRRAVPRRPRRTVHLRFLSSASRQALPGVSFRRPCAES